MKKKINNKMIKCDFVRETAIGQWECSYEGEKFYLLKDQGTLNKETDTVAVYEDILIEALNKGKNKKQKHRNQLIDEEEKKRIDQLQKTYGIEEYSEGENYHGKWKKKAWQPNRQNIVAYFFSRGVPISESEIRALYKKYGNLFTAEQKLLELINTGEIEKVIEKRMNFTPEEKKDRGIGIGPEATSTVLGAPPIEWSPQEKKNDFLEKELERQKRRGNNEKDSFWRQYDGADNIVELYRDRVRFNRKMRKKYESDGKKSD